MNNPITLGEFRNRMERIREEMSLRSLDALIVYSQKRSHVRYISGYNPNYHTNSAMVLLPLNSDPALWVKFNFDLARAKSMSWIKDTQAASQESTLGLVTDCGERIRSLGLEKARIGIVASDLAVDELSVSLYQSIQNELPRVEFELASDLMNSIRAVKSPAEIERLRQSAQLADTVVTALRSAIRPGTTALQAGSKAEQVARAEGARCDIIISTGASKLAYPADNSSFATGSVVTCEITIEFEGYWVQICRTLSVGKPSDSQKRLFSASRRAYEAGVAASVPGNSPATVWQRISDSLRQDDCYQWNQYGLGHGVGLDLPELYPVERDCLTKLKHNMILVLHPALWVPKENAAAWTGGPIAVDHPHPLQLDTPQSEIIEV